MEAFILGLGVGIALCVIALLFVQLESDSLERRLMSAVASRRLLRESKAAQKQAQSARLWAARFNRQSYGLVSEALETRPPRWIDTPEADELYRSEP